MSEYKTEKSESYYQDARGDLVQLVEAGRHRILDVGCGAGSLGAALKAAGKAREVIGIEKHEAAAHVAESRIDRVLCADVETAELPLEEGTFDYIVAADVLEHLVDPWTVVKRLARLLRSGGHMIASIPNVRFCKVVLPLIVQGEWRYRSQGVLDDTHLRFFTKKSMRRLFDEPSLVVRQILPAFKLLPGCKAHRLNRFTLGLFEDFLTIRYLVEVTKR